MLNSVSAVKNAATRFRPLSIGQIIDQAVRLYRRNFLKMIGIFAVVQVPVALLNIIASAQTSTSMLDYLRQASAATPDETFWSNYFISLSLNLLLGVAGFVLLQVVGAAALTRYITNYLTGQSTDILETYNSIGKDWLRLLGVVLVIAFVSLAALLWTIFVPCIGWATGPSILIFLVVVLAPLVTPIVILEKKSGSAALRRAWDLARRRFWVLIGFTLMLTVFSQFLIAGPTALAQMVLYSIFDINQYNASQVVTVSIIQSILQLFLSLLFTPLQLSAFTLMYYDLRVRAEGLDLAMLAYQTSSQAANTPLNYNAVIAHSPPPETGPLLTRGDYGKFALISMIAVGFYLFIFLAFMFFAMLLFALTTEIPV